MDLSTGIANAFSVLKPQDLDRIVVVYDSESSRVAQAFRHAQVTKDLRLNMKLLQLDEGASKLYRDVPPRIVDEVRAFKPAIAINLLSPDICNVTCRVSLLRIEEELRCKIAHVPEGSEEIFSRYMGGDFQGTIDVNRRVCEYLSAASPAQLRATTERGTSLVIDVTGRRWLTDVISLPGAIVNFPCGEVYVAPIERGVNGVLVCDIAVGDLGKIKQPIELRIEGGRCVDIRGESSEKIRDVLSADSESSIVGEFGIGLNQQIPTSSQTTLLLEKAGGTCHLAFGSNEDFGGKNFSSMHTDFVFNKASVFADDRCILENGKLRIQILSF